MTAKRLYWALLILWLGTVVPLSAQESAADRQRLDAIKSRAEKGDAEAQIQLADLYTEGIGVPKDLSKAAKWHRKAAEQGNARGECLLGLDYVDGLGVKKNLPQAVHWLAKAADQGLPGAQFDLAMCYASGDVEGKSVVEAAKLFRKASDQGLPQAQAALGNCYLEGTGVPKNIPQGIEWTRKAAEQGFPAAQQTFGLCYAKGRGVATNYVQAYKWLALAAAKDTQNPDDVKVNLSMVERFMTPEEIAEAQKLAADFVPSGTNAFAVPTTPASAGGRLPVSANQAGTGLVNVMADDNTSDIFVDGAFVGNAPAKLKLAEGPHLIEMKEAGFKDYRKQIQVGAGSELTLHVALEKQ